MLENSQLPEYVKKIFISCAADYKKAHSPYTSKYYSSGGYYSSGSKKFDQNKLSKLFSKVL